MLLEEQILELQKEIITLKEQKKSGYLNLDIDYSKLIDNGFITRRG
jgi:hypothetical protein